MKVLKMEYSNPKKSTSYHGNWLKSNKVEIEVYDKDCGSASCIAIRLEEVSEKDRVTILTNILHKEQAIALKNILNQIEF